MKQKQPGYIKDMKTGLKVPIVGCKRAGLDGQITQVFIGEHAYHYLAAGEEHHKVDRMYKVVWDYNEVRRQTRRTIIKKRDAISEFVMLGYTKRRLDAHQVDRTYFAVCLNPLTNLEAMEKMSEMEHED